MTSDKSSLHLAIFTLALAGTLLAWVEMSLTGVSPTSDGHVSRQVAPGLSIVVQADAPLMTAQLTNTSVTTEVATR